MLIWGEGQATGEQSVNGWDLLLLPPHKAVVGVTEDGSGPAQCFVKVADMPEVAGDCQSEFTRANSLKLVKTKTPPLRAKPELCHGKARRKQYFGMFFGKHAA